MSIFKQLLNTFKIWWRFRDQKRKLNKYLKSQRAEGGSEDWLDLTASLQFTFGDPALTIKKGERLTVRIIKTAQAGGVVYINDGISIMQASGVTPDQLYAAIRANWLYDSLKPAPKLGPLGNQVCGPMSRYETQPTKAEIPEDDRKYYPVERAEFDPDKTFTDLAELMHQDRVQIAASLPYLWPTVPEIDNHSNISIVHSVPPVPAEYQAVWDKLNQEKRELKKVNLAVSLNPKEPRPTGARKKNLKMEKPEVTQDEVTVATVELAIAEATVLTEQIKEAS